MLFLSVLFSFVLVRSVSAQSTPSVPQKPERAIAQRVGLPNGWSLTPVGTSLPLGDLPLNLVISRTGKYAAVTNNGESRQTIQLFGLREVGVGDDLRGARSGGDSGGARGGDGRGGARGGGDLRGARLLDEVTIPKSWLGLCFSRDERFLYASGGNDNWILKYAIRADSLVTVDTFRLGAPWPVRISPAGLTVDDRAGILYVVTKEDNRLYVVDLASHRVLRRLPLNGEGYTCLLSPRGRFLFVSVWGGDKVMFYDTRRGVFADSVAVGDNPNDMCLTRGGRWLYVASANDNKVSVIDTHAHKVIEQLNAALYPTKLSGSTTNGVALSPDEKTLYAANADNNCLAVFDVRHPGSSRSLGFIPTGWYPTCVRTAGTRLFVTNGKGMSSLANPHGPNPYGVGQSVSLHKGDSAKPAAVQYVGGGLLMGTLGIIGAPGGETLRGYTAAVYRNTPYMLSRELLPARQAVVDGGPVPVRVGDSSPIRYVFYLIKENRTYDQVMGDMPEGNGDSSLVLFGGNVTPNQHALARQFVLLDNFYVDGEVSSDGHNWSMGAYADDYLEKTWPTMYGRRGGTEPSSGMKATGNNKDGFIWDDASRSGVTYRTYGEFVSVGGGGRGGASGEGGAGSSGAGRGGLRPNIPVLKDHFCTYFDPLNMHIFDTVREREWERDFDSLVAAGALPRLMTVRFGNDHTEGTAPGRPTPIAHVADNDLAVGRFVAHLSHSRVWGQSVVFILEDDAQNGPDHVDAHRSNAYVAGGYVRRHAVDHTMYTTSSMLRTMELILGMPPMTQYDAAAKPMWNCFARSCDTSSFVARPARVDLGETNPLKGRLAMRSAGLDFSKEDVVPDQVLNDIIWKSVKGEQAVCPMPVRAAFLRVK